MPSLKGCLSAHHKKIIAFAFVESVTQLHIWKKLDVSTPQEDVAKSKCLAVLQEGPVQLMIVSVHTILSTKTAAQQENTDSDAKVAVH